MQASIPKVRKFLFVVQGEGRGHMTQAMVLYDLLQKNGHKVQEVVVGKAKRSDVPTYFINHFDCPVTCIDSPGFVKDEQNKAIKIRKTIFVNLLKFGKYWRTLKKIDELLEKYQPDVVINFYDFLCGVYFLIYRPRISHVCIGHQYLLEHPDFVFPDQVSKSDKLLYFLNTQITSFRAQFKLALSFKYLPDYEPDRLYVVPPLLRSEVLKLTPDTKPYILIYMVYSGFLQDVIEWHKKNRDVHIHLFTDKKDIQEGQVVDDTLVLHKLNDTLFLELMKDCQAYASTAGFESICEALYLGKPVLMVPPEGHFEQMCNALDACLAGAGIQSKTFELEKLLQYIPHYQQRNSQKFREWVLTAEKLLLSRLT